MDDEVLKRRMVGVVTLAVAAFLLSWLLPRPGLERLRAHGERVVTMDLTRADSVPEEIGVSAASTSTSTPETAPVAEAVVPEPGAADAAAALASDAPLRVKPVTALPEPEGRLEPAPASGPVPKPEPKPEPKPTPKPGVPPAGSGSAFVQAGAYSFPDKAESVRSKAASQGVNCVITPAETAKGTLYRVRCGPYADRSAADAAIQKLRGAGIAAQVVRGGR